MPAALVLKGARFGYGAKPPVLTDVDLSVEKGALTVVMGANGSGKSTLLRIAAGLAAPQQGAATMGDGTPTTDAMRRGRIGYIPQHLGLVRSASVQDNVLMGGLSRIGPLSVVGVRPSEERDRVERALDLVGLREKAKAPTSKLSGGERQRVAIARTLVQEPEFIVADELIASLDAVHQHAIVQIARELAKRGTGMLLALHQIDVALANADEIAFLAHGRISPPKRPQEMTAEEARSALSA